MDAPNNVQPPNSPTQRAKLATPTVHDLAVLSPSLRRIALFSDSPLQEHLVPGTLHHTADEHIERLAARYGAVALIRQLAEDVAQRDAQMSALQRRAEEREKTLRKMLLECEVSNMDIEARLHRITLGENASGKKRKAEGGATSIRSTSDEEAMTSSVEGSIGELVNQAMTDAFGHDTKDEPSSPHMQRQVSNNFRHDTVKDTTGIDNSDDYVRFMRSAQSGEARQRGLSRGWMDYLWLSGGTSRKASRASSIVEQNEEDTTSGTVRPRNPSGAAPRRPALQSDLFRPPDDTSSGRSSSQETGEGRGQGYHPGRSSTSILTVILKLDTVKG